MATNSAEGPNIKVEMDMNPLGQDPPSIASSIPNPLKDADFQKAMDSTLSVCRNLSKVLEAFPYGTKRDDLTKLIKTKLIDSHKQLPKAEKIALVGRTGVGKSSLLCALCNDGGLARCEASGEAVRNIIQEFRQRAEGDIDGYKIICTFQTEAEVKEQMSNLLDDLRRYDSDEIETTDPEFTSAQENYHLALDIFNAVFENIEGYDVNLLRDGEEGNSREDAAKLLDFWASGLLPRLKGDQDGQCVHVCSNTQQFQEVIVGYQENQTWPFIDRMEILVDSSLLKEGLVITDLPGLCDENYARVNLTRRYLPVADEIWALTDMSRAVSDKTIADIFEQFFPTRRSNTKSSTGTGAADVGKVKKPRMTIICTCSARHIASWVQMGSLDEDEMDARLDQRASSVTTKLLETYKGRVEPDQLRVFCVDSYLYWIKGEDDRNPDRNLERSGIPLLRQYASNISAKKNFRFHNSRVGYRLPAVFNTIEAWYLQLMSQSEGGTDALCLPSIESAKKDVDSWNREALIPKTKIIQVINKRKEAILLGTREWINSLRRLHASSLAAFCRKQGVHKPKGSRKQIQWGPELNECINQLCAREWKNMDSSLDAAWTKFQKLMKDRFDGYFEQYSQGTTSASILKLLKTTSLNLQHQIRHEKKVFTKQMHKIKSKATAGGIDSYIVAHMSPVWRQCASLSGQGVTKLRINLLKDVVCSDDFLPFYTTKMKTEYEALVKKTKAALVSHVDEAVDALVMESKKKDPSATPYLKRFPKRQIIIKKALDQARDDMVEIARLAKPAQLLAESIWGPETDVENE